jgi:hypothetical protein
MGHPERGQLQHSSAAQYTDHVWLQERCTAAHACGHATGMRHAPTVLAEGWQACAGMRVFSSVCWAQPDEACTRMWVDMVLRLSMRVLPAAVLLALLYVQLWPCAGAVCTRQVPISTRRLCSGACCTAELKLQCSPVNDGRR